MGAKRADTSPLPRSSICASTRKPGTLCQEGAWEGHSVKTVHAVRGGTLWLGPEEERRAQVQRPGPCQKVSVHLQAQVVASGVALLMGLAALLSG